MNELKNKQLHAAFGLLGVTLLVLLFYYGYSMYLERTPETSVVSESPLSKPDFRESLEESVSGANPKLLQEYFAEQVALDTNDDATRSAIYWITHRYFDNGGNIYEVYDFVQSHPEVAFLKEAERIYPTIFADVQARTLPGTYSRNSLLALLSYYDVIDRYGYANIALWGMAANQYAELARGAMRQHEADPKKKYLEETISPLEHMATMIDRSMYYIGRGNSFLKKETQKTGTLDDLLTLSILPDDLLVGLNQYGAAVENIKKVGMVTGVPFETSTLYEFNHTLAKDTVPRLYFFTNYLYASALAGGGVATAETVKVPLGRALEYVQRTSPADWRSSVLRVVNAKTANEGGMYAYETVKTLAKLHDGFRSWLMTQGWKESDF